MPVCLVLFASLIFHPPWWSIKIHHAPETIRHSLTFTQEAGQAPPRLSAPAAYWISLKLILDLSLITMLPIKSASSDVRASFILDNPQNFFECGCPGWNSGILGSHDRLSTSIISGIAYYHYQKQWNESPYLSIYQNHTSITTVPQISVTIFPRAWTKH